MKRDHLSQVLNGHTPAVDFIEALFAVLHFWDDLIDQDRPLSEGEIHTAMWDALVTIPSNPFYRQFLPQLQPVLINAIANWRAANLFERGDSSERHKQIAFVIRSDYANILIQCVYLVGGRDAVIAATPYIREYWTEEDFGAYLDNLALERMTRDSQVGE